jgi:serine protease Do
LYTVHTKIKLALHAFVHSALLWNFIVSVCGTLAVLALCAYGAFAHKDTLLALLHDEYSDRFPITVTNQISDSKTPPVLVAEKTQAVAPPQTTEKNIIDVVKSTKPSVVSILVRKKVVSKSEEAKQTEEIVEVGKGSGFIVSSDGYIVTNRHVVSLVDGLFDVVLNNGTSYTAEVLARDAVYDLAIMKISAKGLPYLRLADSNTLDVGQSVIAIGDALGEFKNSVSVGVISGLSRSVNAGDGRGALERLERVIQTDAAINPGNSGGPLINLRGEVVGINVAIIEGSSNVGFALPINSVKDIIQSVKKTGSIARPYIGIRYSPITKERAFAQSLSFDHGILVERGGKDESAVLPGSPAEKAGIQEGDIVLSVDSTQDFAFLVREKKIGNPVVLEVATKGIVRTVTLVLGKAPSF